MPNLPDIRGKVKIEFSDIEAAAVKAKLLGDVLKRELGGSTGSEVERSMANIGRGLTNVSNNTSSTHSGVVALGAAFTSLGGLVIPILVGIAVALSPVILLLGAFALGLAAVLTVATLVVGGIGLLAGGIFLLAQRTGAIAGPIQNITTQFKNMADVLGRLAAPMASRMLDLISGLLPYVERLGVQLLQWFGPRLEGILTLAQRAFFAVVDAIRQLGQTFDFVFTAFTEGQDKLGPILAGTLQFVVRAVDGLVVNLVRLSEWFVVRLPTLGPIVAQIMGFIGAAFLGMIQFAGRVVDFFIANWPRIVAEIQGVWDKIQTGVQFVLPLLGLARAAFEHLGPVVQFVRDHADSLKPVLYAVGGLLVIIAADAVITLAAVVLLIAGITALAAALSTAVSWLRDHIPGAISAAGGAFSALGGFVRGVVDRIGEALSALGRLRDAILNLPVVGGAVHALHIPGLQHGGVALPGQMFRVGEAGPELGYALPGGGVVITPASSSVTNNTGRNTIIIQGAGLSAEQVALAIDRRLSRLLTST